MPDYAKTSDHATLAEAVAATDSVLDVDSDVTLTAPFTINRPLRIVDGGGSISGAGLRVRTEGAEIEGVKFPAPTGRALSFANGSVGCKATGVQIRGAGDHGLVDQGEENEITECKIYSSAGHNLWALGSDGGKYLRNETAWAGHQNFELNHAVNFLVDYHHSFEGTSLGIHCLRSTHGRIRRARSHRNRNNGCDLNGSSFVKVFDILSWENGAPRDSAGAPEGTGLLLYQSNNIEVRGGAAWDNAIGQPNGRDGLAIVGSETTPTYKVKAEGFVGFDTRTPPSQRSGVGLRAKVPGQVHDVELISCDQGYGNVSGTLGFTNVEPERDRITIR